jgi:hypothetical protein
MKKVQERKTPPPPCAVCAGKIPGFRCGCPRSEWFNAYHAAREAACEATMKELRDRPFEELLNSPIAGLPLSVRSRHCLENKNIRTIRELLAWDQEELLESTKNFGRKSLNEVKEIVHELGLSFAPAPEFEKVFFEDWRADDPCPFCHTGQTDVIMRSRGALGEFERRQCRNCLLRFICPSAGTAADIQELERLASK